MKYIILVFTLIGLSSFGICKEAQIPTCEAAAQAIMDNIMEEGSGDCSYVYTNPKQISVDKKEGVVTCQAKMERTCVDMPQENLTETQQYTAKYGIVTHFTSDEY